MKWKKYYFSLVKEKSSKYFFRLVAAIQVRIFKNFSLLIKQFFFCCFVKHVRMHLKPTNDDSDLWE